jgi:phosphoribosylamine---glycine ligase
MNILVVGHGGREHALAWKIRQSPSCHKLFVAPGNAGTSQVAENCPIGVNEFKKLGLLCLQEDIGLVVIGPEGPLVNGLRDYFESDPLLNGILLVGPGKSGARLEGSKDFSKQFMIRHGIPTARAKTFKTQDLNAAFQYLEGCQLPIVLKADGLAAGKGVIISPSVSDAKESLREMLQDKKFGVAGESVLVEEFLDGIELSVFVLTDGEDYVLLPEAKDYKRIGDGDQGLNTGGMGAVSPVVFATEHFLKKVEERIIKPTIRGLKSEGIPYRGFIFVGLMNVKGEPFVIEYNARLGDPETEAIMPRIKGDFVDLLVAAANGTLKNKTVEVEKNHAVSIVMVSGGYPEEYEKGKLIEGLGNIHQAAFVFHAGTTQTPHGVKTDGGRVLAVTGSGDSIATAAGNAYRTISSIRWDQVYFRKDIGLDLQKWQG